ncbi:hypothetical protein RFI_00012 [Reticulomyxa filosa]|uniref:Exonuclease 1 n=1 Tax=Reticulomyxa filosa TaxID=46433 RepID=X6PG94_RETFI|nr:hypothetical protein RFI_00012 [Reticulomyxa filosa]|eukprot:ETO37049.1 hypothetical protein RFI_00012 [Reticulomyxa filosa]
MVKYLQKYLEMIIQKSNLQVFSGETAGVDGNWLCKGGSFVTLKNAKQVSQYLNIRFICLLTKKQLTVQSCAEFDLASSRFCGVESIEILKTYGIRLTVVFEGKKLLLDVTQEQIKTAESKKAAESETTPLTKVEELQKKLKEKGIEYIVAPYQDWLTKKEKNVVFIKIESWCTIDFYAQKKASGYWVEKMLLSVYRFGRGKKCIFNCNKTEILYKKKRNGGCKYLNMSYIKMYPPSMQQDKKEILLKALQENNDHETFVMPKFFFLYLSKFEFCVLAGCDYFQIDGMNVEKAIDIVYNQKQEKLINRIFHYFMQQISHYQYQNVVCHFTQAVMAYLCPIVYDHSAKVCTRLNTIISTELASKNSAISKPEQFLLPFRAHQRFLKKQFHQKRSLTDMQDTDVNDLAFAKPSQFLIGAKKSRPSASLRLSLLKKNEFVLV